MKKEDERSREIVSVRILEHPRELVFKAYTMPNYLAKWWGPNGFTNTFKEFDLKPGGKWKFVMHGPDGKDYQNEVIFQEISEPKIVLMHVSPPKFELTFTFEDLNGKTKITMRQLFDSAAECNLVKRYAVDANEENFDRLEDLLAGMAKKK